MTLNQTITDALDTLFGDLTSLAFRHGTEELQAAWDAAAAVEDALLAHQALEKLTGVPEESRFLDDTLPPAPNGDNPQARLVIEVPLSPDTSRAVGENLSAGRPAFLIANSTEGRILVQLEPTP